MRQALGIAQNAPLGESSFTDFNTDETMGSQVAIISHVEMHSP